MKLDGATAGAVGGAVAALALAPWAVQSVSSLRDARQVRADLATLVAAPQAGPAPMVPQDLRTPGGSESRATAAMQARLRDAAAKGGVLVESARPIAGGPGLVAIELRVSGPAKAVIAMIDSLERDAPLARLQQWQASALPDGGLRIEGRVIASWR